ncbi:MAG TPA: 50S ribosomal protein L19 [Negativicutes bacterium]|uniref:Large ribosomal subunit protein bL19 n=1 Tax=Candidatus Staskawiczbacteria bacterium RIFCSPHIGHO2_01_FULL_41_41 TaxID=1802203 RepID=A0A1G2HVL4_9BACT|nr:MAG: 50S ribosomal protein L19 [Candidatus Staskawiczbacteria bacterium RIFCSPHIGHO2_01_FULL_41_41]OGZ68894.1 MAG: 50S ribosomal protein L19 [Candidatus Staskawiczbacteria bacterium RIFCSPHIGHO2_02_FULL_43_16]OGZ74924.1 MAG: 50S ribosomal protein L19 [Candidatus Staskawiczbacteria bacterium RIFCSPLOWO2_01_FULL_43_17b]HLD70611.1 50S ribosomal protein L19 [Negativicutes bacterium]
MNKQIETFQKSQLKTMPDIRPGDTVKVHQKIKEGDKERIQIFEGLVIARKHGKGINSTITVRKVVEQIGVERIFPVHSPSIAKIEVVKSGKVRRSKLYYLRTAKGTKAKLKKRNLSAAIAPEVVAEAPVVEAPEIVVPTEETK